MRRKSTQAIKVLESWGWWELSTGGLTNGSARSLVKLILRVPNTGGFPLQRQDILIYVSVE